MSGVATTHPPFLAGDARGSNQSGVRQYNERLVLSLIRRHGRLAKAEIARQTALSPQTVSVIVKALEADGLVLKQPPLRGRVGQPSVPFALDPAGAFALGLKIGRRSADLVLIDFTGTVLETRRLVYAYPRCAEILPFACDGAHAIIEAMPGRSRGRLAGIGVATPFEIWNWAEEIGAPAAELEPWRGFDIAAELEHRLDLQAVVCNDASAACAAELTLGEALPFSDFLYIHIGSFIGGGVVLGGHLFLGRSGNAGALGSMPIATADLGLKQLIHAGSIATLERILRRDGVDPSPLWQQPEAWPVPGRLIERWIAQSATAIAIAITAACSVIDFEAAIVDGSIPPAVRGRIVSAVRDALTRVDRQGLSPIEIRPGSIGPFARAIGGATLPLLARFAPDREVLFKDAGSAAVAGP